MGNLRKIQLFDNDENASVTAKRADIAADDSIKNVFGIDLGTTNSVISIVKKGAPEVITLNSGKKTFPSCVMWKDGEFYIGDDAYRNKGLPNVIYSVKRLMEDPSATVTFKDGDKELTMTPTEVSSEILKGIVKATDGMYGEVHDVVVTVPAYFNDIGKRNTMKACELAGLNLIALENEPSAAALEYDLPEGVVSEDVIVYDLGGGTFDVTLANIMKVSSSDADDIYGFGDSSEVGSSSKIIKPIAIGGDAKLGGDDIDNELFKIVARKIKLDPDSVTDIDTKKITSKLERLKKAGVDQTYEMEFKATLKDGTYVDTKVFVTPEDFVDSCEPIYRRTRKVLNKVLAERPNSASKILLVGGSTKNPIIQDFLHRDYSTFEISSALNPDLVVSTGASVKGRIIKYGDSSISSFDILPITIGILDGETMVTPVIKKNEELPVSHAAKFTTEIDNQEYMRVSIYQGNSTFKDECVHLGDLMIDGIPKAKAGEPVLVVNLTITANNVLTCEATINGETKSLSLNLNNADTTVAHEHTKEEKKLLRWREFARTLGGDAGKKLNEMLDGYPDSYSEKEIKDYIRSVRS